MKNTRILFFTFFSIASLFCFSPSIHGQNRETYTGTVLSYGSGVNTRTTTGTFTLIINSTTSDQQSQKFLSLLEESGQDALKNSIDNEDLGQFSIGPSVGVPINVVRESEVDGKRRIFIVFRRYTQFAELRGGYRSLDYPFGVIELYIDKNTGKGEGTYIAAARIRFTQDKKNKAKSG